MTNGLLLTAAVEGIVDEAILRRLCRYVGTGLATVYGKTGKHYVLRRLAGYNHSAKFRHWVVLVDLDRDGECAPEVIPAWLPTPSKLMCLRVAVREVEAWILADPERVANYFGVVHSEIPVDPERILDPKQTMVNLGRHSRRREIRDDLVPRTGSGQIVGPAYASRIIAFVQNEGAGWRPDVAANNSDSLKGCLEAISRLSRMPYPESAV